MDFSLGLTSRYADPDTALDGLILAVNGEVVPSAGEVLHEEFASIRDAEATSTSLEVRFGGQVLDRLTLSPGDVCVAARGDGNTLVTESVNLCVRANGELQLNDFSCEYRETGYFTADVFCPTDCHPLLGGGACGDDRCGLVLTRNRPRFGRLACVPIGELELGESCAEPLPGEPDLCSVGLACVFGKCRSFCLDSRDCADPGRCVSALRGVAEPLICMDSDSVQPLAPASLD